MLLISVGARPVRQRLGYGWFWDPPRVGLVSSTPSSGFPRSLYVSKRHYIIKLLLCIASHHIALHCTFWFYMHQVLGKISKWEKKITLTGTNDRNQKQRGLTNDDRRSKGDLQRTWMNEWVKRRENDAATKERVEASGVVPWNEWMAHSRVKYCGVVAATQEPHVRGSVAGRVWRGGVGCDAGALCLRLKPRKMKWMRTS